MEHYKCCSQNDSYVTNWGIEIWISTNYSPWPTDNGQTSNFQIDQKLTKTKPPNRDFSLAYDYSQGDSREGGWLWWAPCWNGSVSDVLASEDEIYHHYLVQSNIPSYLLFEMEISGFLQIVALGLLIKHKLRNFRLSHYWPKHGPLPPIQLSLIVSNGYLVTNVAIYWQAGS